MLQGMFYKQFCIMRMLLVININSITVSSVDVL